MKQEMYDSMYRTERYHWWFHGKRELVLALAAPYLSALPAPHIIDFGCGCGAMLEALSPFGTVTGADFSPLALDYCRKRFPASSASSTFPFRLCQTPALTSASRWMFWSISKTT